jgi:hypothetical protein
MQSRHSMPQAEDEVRWTFCSSLSRMSVSQCHLRLRDSITPASQVNLHNVLSPTSSCDHDHYRWNASTSLCYQSERWSGSVSLVGNEWKHQRQSFDEKERFGHLAVVPPTTTTISISTSTTSTTGFHLDDEHHSRKSTSPIRNFWISRSTSASNSFWHDSAYVSFCNSRSFRCTTDLLS